MFYFKFTLIIKNIELSKYIFKYLYLQYIIMESRKIQKVGYSSLAVSLPHSWIEEVGLKKGDEIVFIRGEDGSLRIIPSKLAKREEGVKEAIINAIACDEPGMLERVIVGNYVLGRDVIRIIASGRIKPSHVEEIRRIVKRLIGIGIVEETPTQIILQCAIDPSKFPINTVMRRLYVISSIMYKEAVQALIDSDYDLATEVMKREDEADMMYWLTVRLLLSSIYDRSIADKIGIRDLRHIAGNRAVAQRLEHMADLACNIAEDCIKMRECSTKGKVDDKVLIDKISSLNEQIYDLTHKAIEALLTGDIKLATSVINIRRKTVKPAVETLIGEVITKIPDSCIAVFLSDVVWNMGRVADICKEIAEVAINRALEKSSKLCEVYEETHSF